MERYKYYRYPSGKIEIQKKTPDENREAIVNISLNALQKQKTVKTQHFEYLKLLIIEFNKKIQSKKIDELVRILRIWLKS
jgi:hypothetical protein